MMAQIYASKAMDDEKKIKQLKAEIDKEESEVEAIDAKKKHQATKNKKMKELQALESTKALKEEYEAKFLTLESNNKVLSTGYAQLDGELQETKAQLKTVTRENTGLTVAALEKDTELKSMKYEK